MFEKVRLSGLGFPWALGDLFRVKEFPPMRIGLAGAIFISFGAFGLIELLFVAVSDKTDAGVFNFFGLFIGYGLVIGRSSSRAWALFWALLLTVIGVISLFTDVRSRNLDQLGSSLETIIPAAFII
ncbi:MAG: hypothetical protein QNK83_01965 [Akkermansiaceae bacterium]|nr:hypothetical protein [Akkermansiaceae bacterium]MDB4562842.1 hypothetical protein [Akkermansiaceae bacterium]MDB4645610.1 hypothetical protein [Akkermansiaceae bacterium]